MIRKSDIGMRKAAILIIVAVVCAGCRSAAPPVSFYTLSAIARADSRPLPDSTMQGPLIGVGPAHFPGYLDRPQIVTRSGAHRLEMSEFNRWAGRLDRDFLDVLAENLSILLPSHRVAVHPWKLQDDPDYRIELDVHQFEAKTGGSVVLSTTWTIRGRGQGGEPLNAARSLISLPASGQDYDALVSKYSQAVAELSREVSAALSGLSKQAETQASHSKNP